MVHALGRMRSLTRPASPTEDQASNLASHVVRAVFRRASIREFDT